uniref:Uncharacterized protein n=1 Tax=Timema douglasi TaxID=61478 RepID=A0A7R8VQL7_TIMDO|nr:unnamed protein product [Timema douglasi]
MCRVKHDKQREVEQIGEGDKKLSNTTKYNITTSARSSGHLGDSIHTVANQLLASRYVDSDQEAMVEADIRTPPKLQVLKQQYEEKVNQGVAVPVIIEDEDDMEKVMDKLKEVEPIHLPPPPASIKKTSYVMQTTSKPQPTTMSNSISTWILLSGSSSTPVTQLTTTRFTPSKKTKITTMANHPKSTTPSPSSSKPSTNFLTTKKPYPTFTTNSLMVTKPKIAVSNNSVYSKIISSDTPNKKAARPMSTTTSPFTINDKITKGKISPNASPESTLSKDDESMNTNNKRKNQQNHATVKPIIQTLTRRPNPANVKLSNSMERNHTKFEVIGLASRRKPTTKPTPVKSSTSIEDNIKSPITTVSYNDILTITPIPTSFEDTELISDTTAIEQSSVEGQSSSESTTKRTRRPSTGEKKKKKNKNRRRRPSKKPSNSTDIAESKVTDDGNVTKIISGNKERPLSTRIYNYLAREVMPTVGVGLVGLVLTAGLAGLIMYPFGGGAARRTYQVQQSPTRVYNNNDRYYYNSEYDNGQSEEEVFGKVLAGMKKDEVTAYAGDKTYGTSHESRYGDNAEGIRYGMGSNQENRYGGSRVEASQESGYGSISKFDGTGYEGMKHSTTHAYPGKPQYQYEPQDSSRISIAENSSPVYGGNIRYRQVAVGSSYMGKVSDPETQEVTLEDKITPIVVESDSLDKYMKSGTGSVHNIQGHSSMVERGPVSSPVVEHGPRSLRQRRDLFSDNSTTDNNDLDNEIHSITDGMTLINKLSNKEQIKNEKVKPTNTLKPEKVSEKLTKVIYDPQTNSSDKKMEDAVSPVPQKEYITEDTIQDITTNSKIPQQMFESDTTILPPEFPTTSREVFIGNTEVNSEVDDMTTSSSRAQAAKIAQSQESSVHAELRRQEQAELQAALRADETPFQSQERLEDQDTRQASMRAAEKPLQLQLPERQAALRATETPHQTQQRLNEQTEGQRALRASETPYQTQLSLDDQDERQRALRATETPLQTLPRLEKQAQWQAAIRVTETTQHLQARRIVHAEMQTERRRTFMRNKHDHVNSETEPMDGKEKGREEEGREIKT